MDDIKITFPKDDRWWHENRNGFVKLTGIRVQQYGYNEGDSRTAIDYYGANGWRVRGGSVMPQEAFIEMCVEGLKVCAPELLKGEEKQMAASLDFDRAYVRAYVNGINGDQLTKDVYSSLQLEWEKHMQKNGLFLSIEEMTILESTEDSMTLELILVNDYNKPFEQVDLLKLKDLPTDIYVYATRSRPAFIGTVPEGYYGLDDDETEDYPYGMIWYTRKLTDEEIWKYELQRVSRNTYPHQVGEAIRCKDADAVVLELLPRNVMRVRYTTDCINGVEELILLADDWNW